MHVRFVAVMALLAVVGGCSSACPSPLAIGRDQEGEFGRYVGGGAHFGQPRRPHEGIWARDYAGLDVFHLIEMRWSHSDRFTQGGMGSY